MAPSPPNFKRRQQLITVKCTKGCLWAIHHAWGPNFQIKEGTVLGAEFPKNTNTGDWEAFKYKLLDAGHAELIPNADPDESQDAGEGDADGGDDNTGDSGEGDTTEVTPESLKAELEGVALNEMDGTMGSEKKAKAALEAIGKERYGFDVDKRMGIDKIIEAIVKEAFKDNK